MENVNFDKDQNPIKSISQTFENTQNSTRNTQYENLRSEDSTENLTANGII